MHWYIWGVCSKQLHLADRVTQSALLACLVPSCEVIALCAVCLRSGPAGWVLEREGSCGCIGDALDHRGCLEAMPLRCPTMIGSLCASLHPGPSVCGYAMSMPPGVPTPCVLHHLHALHYLHMLRQWPVTPWHRPLRRYRPQPCRLGPGVRRSEWAPAVLSTCCPPLPARAIHHLHIHRQWLVTLWHWPLRHLLAAGKSLAAWAQV